MKSLKHILLLLFLCQSILLYAHKYIPMLVKGNTWNVLHYGYDYNLTQILKVSSDTLIDSLKYNKIISSYDSLSSVWSLVGFMREDTIAQIIYYKSLDSTAKELIYYCFNVKINDYFKLTSTGNDIHDTISYTFNQVVALDSIQIGNYYHKMVTVANCDGFCDPICKGDSITSFVWIEGIGGMSGLLESSVLPTVADPRQLQCFYKNDSLEYKVDTGKYQNCFYWEHLIQPYDSFPSKNTVWTEMYTNPYPDEFSVFHCFALKNNDTIINNLVYHKLYHSTDTNFTEKTLCGGLREENRKIYYYSINPISYTDMTIPSDTEVLLYDFSLKLNDTLTYLKYRISGGPLYTTFIDSIYIGTGYREFWHFGESPVPNIDLFPWAEWVEGIGSLRGLLFATGTYPDNGLWNDLICFKQNNQLLYHNNSYSQCYYINADSTAINKKQVNYSINIFPNPIHYEGIAEFSPNGYSSMDITDIYGIVRREYNIDGLSSLEIYKNELPTGVYFFVFIGKQGDRQTVKVIFN